jgi:hypothetical protein
MLPVDLALGVVGPAWQLASVTTRAMARLVRPAFEVTLHPRGVPAPLQPGTWVRDIGRAGADRRDVVASELSRRLDIVVPAVLDTVLDRLDLTSVVVRRVDLETVAAAVLAELDLVGLAEDIIDGVDLPEIIRESTGSMASETVSGARMQGISADEAVGRAVDRLLLRSRPRSVRGPVHGDETVTSTSRSVTEQAP